MVTFFTICAIIGGTVLICQFVLTLIGLGGHGDMGGLHVGDIGHEMAHGMTGDLASPDGHDAQGHHGSTWLFGVITFRTMVAALTFFGLGGLAAESIRQTIPVQLLTATVFGAAAMYAVHYIMRLFGRLAEDGTVRIQRAVGLEGTVYLTIPPNRTGVGKIHITMQNRLMEYPAVTANEEKLATGAKVLVVDVVSADTLVVEPIREQVAAA